MQGRIAARRAPGRPRARLPAAHWCCGRSESNPPGAGWPSGVRSLDVGHGVQAVRSRSSGAAAVAWRGRWVSPAFSARARARARASAVPLDCSRSVCSPKRSASARGRRRSRARGFWCGSVRVRLGRSGCSWGAAVPWPRRARCTPSCRSARVRRVRRVRAGCPTDAHGQWRSGGPRRGRWRAARGCGRRAATPTGSPPRYGYGGGPGCHPGRPRAAGAAVRRWPTCCTPPAPLRTHCPPSRREGAH
ncbi:hypothetical protein ACVWXB_007440 [Streptomyces sp. TE12347]